MAETESVQLKTLWDRTKIVIRTSIKLVKSEIARHLIGLNVKVFAGDENWRTGRSERQTERLMGN